MTARFDAEPAKSQESFRKPQHQWTAKGASGKGPIQKTSNIVEKCQIFSTLFDIFRAGQETSKSSKSVNNIFDIFRQFSRGTSFPTPFGGALTTAGSFSKALPVQWEAYCGTGVLRYKLEVYCGLSLSKTIFQPASRLEKLLEGLLGSSGFERKFPEGGLDFLEVAAV